MKFKIDWQQVRADPLHLGRIAIYIVVFGILVSIVDVDGIFFRELPQWVHAIPGWGILAPQAMAGGLQAEEAIERMSGQPKNRSWRRTHSGILIGILLLFILGPTLLVWGLRTRAQWRQMSAPRGSPFRIAAALTVGGYLFVGLTVTTMMTSLVSLRNFRTQKSESALAANRDALALDLSLMAFKAQTFYHLPTKDGGGDGHWTKLPGREPSTLTLEDLALGKSLMAHILDPLFPQQPSRFVLEVFKEDSLAIWGIGHERIADPTFLNKDGQRGKIQVQYIVTPTATSVYDNL